MLLTLGGAALVVATVIWGFGQMDSILMNKVSTSAANIMLMLIIIAFILAGVRKKINVYDAFIEGAKEGFTTAVRIIPYLVAILVGIGVFRASGRCEIWRRGLRRQHRFCWRTTYCTDETAERQRRSRYDG